MVILDTNALFLPFRTGLDLATEVDRALPGAELVVPSSVVGELERLVTEGAGHARAARELARRFRPVPTDDRGDAAILSVAVRERALVVTADRPLARRLVARGIGVLLPRDRTRLELRAPGVGRPPAGPPARARAATVKKRARLDSGRTSDARRRPPARPSRARVRHRDRRRL